MELKEKKLVWIYVLLAKKIFVQRNLPVRSMEEED